MRLVSGLPGNSRGASQNDGFPHGRCSLGRAPYIRGRPDTLSLSVWLLEDLAAELERQGLSAEQSHSKIDGILVGMRVLTAELFRVSRG